VPPSSERPGIAGLKKGKERKRVSQRHEEINLLKKGRKRGIERSLMKPNV